MASAQVVETSVTNNSPSQDSNHPDDLFQSRYVTPGFKPFSYKEGPGFVEPARFSKVPKTFRARKAIRKTQTCMFCEAGLFML